MLAAALEDGADEIIVGRRRPGYTGSHASTVFGAAAMHVPKAIATSEMPTAVPYACITSNARSPQMSSSLKNVTSIFASFDLVICSFTTAFYALYRTIYHIFNPLASLFYPYTAANKAREDSVPWGEEAE